MLTLTRRHWRDRTSASDALSAIWFRDAAVCLHTGSKTGSSAPSSPQTEMARHIENMDTHNTPGASTGCSSWSWNRLCPFYSVINGFMKRLHSRNKAQVVWRRFQRRWENQREQIKSLLSTLAEFPLVLISCCPLPRHSLRRFCINELVLARSLKQHLIVRGSLCF